MAMINVLIKTYSLDKVCQTTDTVQGPMGVETHESFRQR
jgi:hypothetical protein